MTTNKIVKGTLVNDIDMNMILARAISFKSFARLSLSQKVFEGNFSPSMKPAQSNS